MFVGNFKDIAKQNTNFRQVIMTGEHSQIVAMCLPPGVDIGIETHETIDQIFLFIKGTGEAEVDGQTVEIAKKSILHVPAGSRHNVRNTGTEDLKLLTIYAPPAHPAGTVHATKEAAENAETPPPVPAPTAEPIDMPEPHPTGVQL